MNTSLSWIKKYVPELDVTAQEYTDAMTLSGTKVEGYVQLDEDLEKIVIGQMPCGRRSRWKTDSRRCENQKRKIKRNRFLRHDVFY